MRFEGRDGPAAGVRGGGAPACGADAARGRRGAAAWYPTGAPRGRAPGPSSAARATSAPAGATATTWPSSAAPIRPTIDGERLRLRTDRFVLEVTPAPFALRWSLPGGEGLFADHPEARYRVATDGGRGVRHTLRRDLGDVYLGLGEASGTLDRHHRRYRLRPGDALGYDAELADPLYKHLPVVLSLNPAGHASGILYDSGAEATFDLGSEVDHYLGPYRYTQLQATELDAYVLIGPALPDVVRRIQDLTGYAPLPPRWSLGYLGSTMRYTDAEDPAAELAGFVASSREHRIGCSGFHLSSGYSLGDDGRRYVFEWNRRRVPEPAAMLAPARRRASARSPTSSRRCSTRTRTTRRWRRPGPSCGRRGGPEDGDAPYRNRFWGGDGGYVDFTAPSGVRLVARPRARADPRGRHRRQLERQQRVPHRGRRGPLRGRRGRRPAAHADAADEPRQPRRPARRAHPERATTRSPAPAASACSATPRPGRATT
jgi:hypothetical protein